MKRAWRKIYQYELLCDYLLFSFLVLFSGGLLIWQIAKIAGMTDLTVSSTRFAIFFVAAFLAIVLLTGFSLYRKSVSYILWYKEIFNSIPMPLIVTDENAVWLQVNTAAREAMNLKGKRSFENLNSRHLVNAEGGIKNRIWFHAGENYQVSGKRLRSGGKHAGYLICLNSADEASESVAMHAETLGKVSEYIQRLSRETEYLRTCAKNVSGHMVWQSDIITNLLEIIDEIVSGNLTDPQSLNERIYTVKADIQSHAENSQTDLERMQQITQEWDAVGDPSDSCIHENDTA